MDTNLMTLDAWAADAKETIDRYVAEYKKDSSQAPADQHWPLIQAPGEWDDQFRSFSE